MHSALYEGGLYEKKYKTKMADTTVSVNDSRIPYGVPRPDDSDRSICTASVLCGKCRKQFINSKQASKWGNQIFPYKYHNATDNHSGKCTISIGTFPE